MSERGKAADSAMRAANIADVGAQSVLGFERFRRFAQTGTLKGARAAGGRAATLGSAYARRAGPISLAVEAGNAAWLVADPDKRKRVEAEWDETAKAPAIERAAEAALSPTDALYAVGRAAYDTGKTYESIERSQMDNINTALLRKIAFHEAQAQKERASQNRQSEIDALSASLPAPPLGVPPPPSLYDAWVRKAKTPMLKRR